MIFTVLLFFIGFGISKFLPSSGPSPGYMHQKENPETFHQVISWVTRFLVGLPAFFYLSEYSYIFMLSYVFSLVILGVFLEP